MDGIESFSKSYDIDGNVELLQFCISLFSVDQSVGTFLSAAFGKSEENANTFGPSFSSFPSSSYVQFGEERLEEKRQIEWMEKVAKPTVGTGQLDAEGEQQEEEEGKVTEEREKRPGGRRSNALSHRIFTICEMETKLRYAKQRQKSEEQTPTKRKETLSSKEPIQFLSSDQRQLSRQNEGNGQRMRIMTYLGSDQVYDPTEEYLLWELRMANGRRLITDWDLDKIRSVNSVKTGKMFRAQLTVKEPTQTDEIKGKKKGQHRWGDGTEEEDERSGEAADKGFEVPERGEDYWTHWTVEIGRGIGFLHDNLRVEWTMELPENCQCLSTQQFGENGGDQQQQKHAARPLKGMTQKCAVKSVQRDDVAQFGYPIEFSLNYGPPTAEQTTTTTEELFWPRILFTVIAEDSWGRIYVEGFAVLALPVTFDPSPRHICLDCVRPISPLSKVRALQEAHLGHAEELAQLKSLGEKMFYHEEIATELGGKLEITIGNVHQCRQYISRDILRSLKYSTMMRRIGISEELQCRIAKVLAEFERVRQQLIKARKSRIVARK